MSNSSPIKETTSRERNINSRDVRLATLTIFWGWIFSKARDFSLDIDRRELTFFGDATASGRPKPFRRLGPDGRLVGVDLRLGNTAAVGLFDSGAEVSAVDQRFIRKHKGLFTAVKAKARASGVGGKRISLKVYKIKSLDLGEGRRPARPLCDLL